MRHSRLLRAAILLAAGSCWAASVAAATIQIDYSTDTSNFFGAGNPQGAAAGAQAKAALDTAANFLSGILGDTLSAIQTPPPFHSATRGGTVTWRWTATFSHPATGVTNALVNPTIGADEYRVYVGARSLPGNTAAAGAAGGYSWNRNVTGNFTSQEINQIEQIHDQFVTAVDWRGDPTGGFARWGGAFTVDSDADASWHFNHLTTPPSNKTDFYSAALHELVHTLGFGSSETWTSQIVGNSFEGPAAMSQYGGLVPLHTDKGHWQDGLGSPIFGATAFQETLMDPTLTFGNRKRLTRLDAAGLVDIGWEVTGIPGDYNWNGIVDAADYTVWRNTRGQTGAGLAADGSGNKIVDQADYNIWRSSFIAGAGSGAVADGVVTVVPEPDGLTLLFVAALAVAARRSGALRADC